MVKLPLPKINLSCGVLLGYRLEWKPGEYLFETPENFAKEICRDSARIWGLYTEPQHECSSAVTVYRGQYWVQPKHVYVYGKYLDGLIPLYLGPVLYEPTIDENAEPVSQTLEKLDKPARVRGVVFNTGVKVITVIQAAQRCFEEYAPEDAPEIKQEILRGLAKTADRKMLEYLMQQFNFEEWNCERCGYSESTSECDSADLLRRYLTGDKTAMRWLSDDLKRLPTIEQAGAIKKASELTDDGYYWYRVKPSRQWKILHITTPQRLSYGIAPFEFLGPILAPAE